MLKEIAETLRIERLRRKMTLRELSEASTVSIKQISDIENEKVIPNLKTVEKLAGVLGLKLNMKAKAVGE